jgi:hypothetical protein
MTPEEREERRWARQEAQEADLRRRLEPVFTEQDSAAVIGRVLGQLFKYGKARAIAGALREGAQLREDARRYQRSAAERRERNQQSADFPLLRVTRPFTKKQVNAAYRREALTCHPDTGGTDARMTALSTERDRALRVATS